MNQCLTKYICGWEAFHSHDGIIVSNICTYREESSAEYCVHYSVENGTCSNQFAIHDRLMKELNIYREKITTSEREEK